MKISPTKFLILSLGLALTGILFAPLATAQTLLVQFYNASGGQTAATSANFTSAGVANLTGSESVLSLDIGAGLNFPTSVTGGGITVTPSNVTADFSYGGPGGNPIYQQAWISGNSDNVDLTIAGLSSKLAANTTYNLYLMATNVSFSAGTNSNDSFSYGAQTGSFTNVNAIGGTTLDFSFTTGSSVTDALSIIASGATTDPSDYQGFSGFAIVGATVPEPSMTALTVGTLGMLVLVFRRRKNGCA